MLYRRSTGRDHHRRVVATTLAILLTLAVAVPASAQDTITTSASAGSTFKWVDEPVTFEAGGIKIYATFRHPVDDPAPVPGVLLIAGSGPTDRNGNSPLEAGKVDTIKTLADWLSQDGVASLRYDKLGSGQTGLGPFATKVNAIGIKPFEQESLAALVFLAAQKGIDAQRLGVFGHSEGALFALLLATGHAGHAPAIHALGLFEPLSLRYLTLITVQVRAQVAAQLTSGEITKKLATTVDATLAKAVTTLRATGKVKADLPYGLDTILNPSTATFLYQADQFDPETLAASLAPHTPVIVSCSTSDLQVSCSQVQRVVRGLERAQAITRFVRLVGVDHVLKVDSTGSALNYTKDLPFSPVLKTAIKEFVEQSLAR
jgi:alpha-beta hydrolase superfamily lysophospholipase